MFGAVRLPTLVVRPDAIYALRSLDRVSGTSWNSSGPHLHFEVHTSGDHGISCAVDAAVLMASVGRHWRVSTKGDESAWLGQTRAPFDRADECVEAAAAVGGIGIQAVRAGRGALIQNNSIRQYLERMEVGRRVAPTIDMPLKCPIMAVTTQRISKEWAIGGTDTFIAVMRGARVPVPAGRYGLCGAT